MKIKILGTRGEIEASAPYHAKKSGLLIDDTLLFDCGDERFLAYKPRAVFITHLHPDHAYFVREHEPVPAGTVFYAPEQYDHGITGITNRPFTIAGYRITPIPTIHSVRVKSNAYLIEYKKKRILYTGDMIWIEKKYHDYLHDLDLVITEASFIRVGGIIRRDKATGKIFGHTGVPNLIKLFKPATHSILFMHFGSWFYKNMQESRVLFKRLAREHDLEIIVGYDGLEITI